MFVFFQSKAQETLVSDSILTLSEYYEQILTYHPLVKQADLLTDIAQQEIRLARGNFDPVLTGEYKAKDYDKKAYYNLLEGGLKVPLWVGEINLDYEQNTGLFLNPENSVPQSGLASAGISIPLAQGLLIDERRVILRQARFAQNIAQVELVKAVNKVLLTAAKQYWEWYLVFQEYRYVREAYELTLIRYEATKQQVEVGDLAPIDSVEAHINLQNRGILLQQLEIDLQNARLLASNHLWGEDQIPLEIPNFLQPQIFNLEERITSQPDLNTLLSFAENQHPEIMSLIFKNQQLGLEERLQRNKLLPKLNLEYNFLNSDIIGGEGEKGDFLVNNYKFGVKFEFPVLLRSTRGKLQQTRLKIDQNEFEQIQTRREVQNSVLTHFNEMSNLTELITLQEEVVQNYTVLLEGEIEKFASGESSVFLINSRETKLLDSQIKLEKLKSLYEKERATLFWASGISNWE